MTKPTHFYKKFFFSFAVSFSFSFTATNHFSLFCPTRKFF